MLKLLKQNICLTNVVYFFMILESIIMLNSTFGHLYCKVNKKVHQVHKISDIDIIVFLFTKHPIESPIHDL